MKINEANIDINRIKGKLISVSIAMPIWDKIGIDEFISVNIPLFGIKTFAKNEDDAQIAVKEAITAFCINAEKYGQSLEAQLRIIGWDFISQTEEMTSMSYNVFNTDSVVDQIMQTGEQFAEKLELAC